jgi:hypothetical protein
MGLPSFIYLLQLLQERMPGGLPSFRIRRESQKKEGRSWGERHKSKKNQSAPGLPDMLLHRASMLPLKQRFRSVYDALDALECSEGTLPASTHPLFDS